MSIHNLNTNSTGILIMRNDKNPWLKNRGYLHLTNQINLISDRKKLLTLIKNKDFISKYAFFPLIHSVIKERRYRNHPENIGSKKCHSYENEDGDVVSHAKNRPLHYATHLDAMIFGYYSEIILNKYEEKLRLFPELEKCVTAYRKIPIVGEEKNKSTIHFAKEVFDEIKFRSENEECIALMFDIKNFFNEIDHDILKETWANLLDQDKLPTDHFNVFKATTRFSFVNKDDFRLSSKKFGRRKGFDETKLAKIRKKGVHAFFESPKEFRDAVKSGELKLQRFPFKNKEGKPVGFPQGLPISATLGNLYLINFDINIVKNLVEEKNVFYRRYSDDIVVLCTRKNMDEVEEFMYNAIKEYKLEISQSKTERFAFKKELINSEERVVSHKIGKQGNETKNIPLTYLGFEFYGHKTLIKSANLAKFYRRMIKSVKTKSSRALHAAKKDPNNPIVLFPNQLYRLYSRHPLRAGVFRKTTKHLQKNSFGEYYYKSKKINLKHSSNYLSYIHRASEIMDEPKIKNQVRNHKKILNLAIQKHITKAREQV